MIESNPRVRFSSTLVLFLAFALGLTATSAWGQTVRSCGITAYFWQGTIGESPKPNNCFGFSGFRCYAAQAAGEPYFRLKNSACDPTAGSCTVQMRIPIEFPGLADMIDEDGVFGSPTPSIYWFDTAQASACPGTQVECGQDSICGVAGSDGQLTYDFLETWVERGVSCASAPSETEVFSIRAMVCRTACRPTDLTVEGLSFADPKLQRDLGCPVYPTEECGDCNSCKRVGPGGAPIGGGGARGGDLLGKTSLRYAAGGAGQDGNIDELIWRPVMGRYWSHTFAQRIILDPDETHVWLITEGATYREYGNLTAGIYETLRPSNDYRTLHRTGAGWELHDLDGTVMEFNNAGRWVSTTDRNGNATTGTYTGSDLTEVSLPDGRLEQFGYTSNRLTSVTEVGVDATLRTWTLTWSGDDLVRLDRPDGTAWVMTYDDVRFPGYLTLLELKGTNGTKRVETGWEYDAEGNVVTLWEGDDTPGGANATNVWSLAFDDPADPEVTTVTDPLGQVTTFEHGDDPKSDRARITSISGPCPSCGLAPNTTFGYTDGTNPMLPTSQVDGNGHTTTYTYDAAGRMLTKSEAAGTAIERTTTWSYDASYPALVTSMTRPSVVAAQDRETLSTRDASGNVTTRKLVATKRGSRSIAPSAVHRATKP